MRRCVESTDGDLQEGWPESAGADDGELHHPATVIAELGRRTGGAGQDGVSFEHLIIDWEFQFRPADTKRDD